MRKIISFESVMEDLESLSIGTFEDNCVDTMTVESMLNSLSDSIMARVNKIVNQYIKGISNDISRLTLELIRYVVYKTGIKNKEVVTNCVDMWLMKKLDSSKRISWEMA